MEREPAPDDTLEKVNLLYAKGSRSYPLRPDEITKLVKLKDEEICLKKRRKDEI